MASIARLIEVRMRHAPGSFHPDCSMSSTDPASPWFRDGLSFTCTRCGSCCTGAPGYVWVDRDEIAQLASHRGEAIEEFTSRHVRRVGDRLSLIEKPGGDCIFWDRQAGCTVYPARPDPVPDLAILARECRIPRGLGGSHTRLPRLGPGPMVQPRRNPGIRREGPSMNRPEIPTTEPSDSSRFRRDLQALYERSTGRWPRSGPPVA